jgi:pimeloyl-ACP methyl ester carboxylesterase
MSSVIETPRNWAGWTEPARIDVEGVEVAYRRKGSGAPLLYLHGAGLTRQWLPLYDRLAESFDVIVPEHPGYGDTPLPDWIRGFDDLVLHYDAFLHALAIDNPHLVGHSLGAWAAAELAVFYPRRFASLTLIAPMGLRAEGATVGDPFRQSPEAMGELLLNGAIESYRSHFEQDEPLEQMLHEYGESITLARLAWNPRYDVRLERRLSRVAAPSLVIHAADDRFVHRAHSERYAELLPGARLEVVEGERGEDAAHLIVLQRPDELARLIAANHQTAASATSTSAK